MRATLAALCIASMLVAGCASVGAREGEMPGGIALDGLAVADHLSDTTHEVLSMLAIQGDCEREAAACARAVIETPGTVREATRLLAAADLLHRGSQRGVRPVQLALDCARHTERYLFAENLEGRKSALDARSQLALRLHDACTSKLVNEVPFDRAEPIRWRWRTDDARFPRADVQRVVLAAGVRTQGLRTRQVDDGLGVAAVAIGQAKGMPMFPPQPFALAINVRYVRDATGESLEVTDASSHQRIDTALGRVDLARDTTAAYALSAALFDEELNAWGGLRRPEAMVTSELRLLAPIDAEKTPLVLVHGFASSPVAWANFANEVLGDPELADRYQVWLARYWTGPPLLANRYALARGIGTLRDAHVSGGGDPSLVIVGHSMGGVLARLLVTDPGMALWNATFAKPPGALGVSPEDEALAQEVFLFKPVPDIDTVVFISTPHGGSEAADGVVARLLRGLVESSAQAIGLLKRIATGAPDAIQPALQPVFAAGGPNSLDTLSPRNPVHRAARGLPIVPGVEAWSLIGIVDPDHPERGDGVVPLESQAWPGAKEVRIRGDHHLQAEPATVAALKRILLDRLARMPPRTGPRE
ncbi:alpha/beta hydrolase [Lysobacter sp. A6]|uniref:Alpha/beta hydrolase n=1 Tax=Noviluteimonas lactosilytica TaxID=2888523 RepID=A0ABS8JJD3_9GAMM|nr:alpha/beta fold hydrolase [Lysobacter lactosilyticus]MCC8363700.1 alpha/beta hydrolase [Lysobacter lactosilyticus]